MKELQKSRKTCGAGPEQAAAKGNGPWELRGRQAMVPRRRGARSWPLEDEKFNRVTEGTFQAENLA